MPDLESALAVKERPDGLLEQVGNFDLASAVPAPNIPEISAPKGPATYSPELTPAQKAQAVVELSYREKGQNVPFALKADWMLTSPQSEAISKTIIAPEFTVWQGFRGAIQNRGQFDLLSNILKGVIEPEKTKKFTQDIPGVSNLPQWAQTTMGIVEDILGTGVVAGVKAAVRNDLLAKNITRKVDLAAEEFAQENMASLLPAGPVTEDVIKNQLKQGFKTEFFRKATALQAEITASEGSIGEASLTGGPSILQAYAQRKGLLSLVFDEMKALDTAGALRIPKIGETVQFISKDAATNQMVTKEGIIKAIEGQRALILLDGRAVVAGLSQIVQPPTEQAITPDVSSEAPVQQPEQITPLKPNEPMDLSNLPQLQKQINAMEDRVMKVNISKDTLNEIENIRESLRHRIQKYNDNYLKEELTGIPSFYITKSGGIKPDQILDELRNNYGIDLRDEVALKEYLQELEATKKSLEADIEAVKPGFITKRETTLLADKVKAVEMGFRAGKTKTKVEVAKTQTELIDMIEQSGISADDRAKFMRLVKNIQTPLQLEGILPEVIDRLLIIRGKAERTGLLDDIKKLFSDQPTESLPIQYKDQIEAIKAKIDPRQQSLGTKQKIESLRVFVKRMEEEGEDINIPEYKLDLLEKTSLDELDNSELEALKESIEQLYHQGRIYNKLFTLQKNQTFEEVTKNTVSDILKGKELSEDSAFVKAIREHNKSFTKAKLETIRNFIYANLRPELMINMLGKVPTEIIFKPLVKADTSEITEGEKHTLKLWESQKAINIPQAYIKKVTIGKYKDITKNNALFIYANSRNEGQLAHLYASGITEEDIQDFTNFLSPDERQAVENLWEYYNSEQWPRLDEVYSKINGAHLGKEESYFPIMNLENVAESYSKELESEMMKRFHLKQAGVTKGFTKGRVASQKAFSNFDYFGTIIKNHEQVEHYIAFAETVRDTNKILRNPDIRAAIIQKYGKEYLKILDTWLKDVAYGGDRAINNMLDKFASFLTQNYVTSVLGYNVLSASKSLVSFLTGVDQIGPAEVTWALGKYMQHPVKLTQFVYSKSDMMKHRDFTQEKEFKNILAGREAFLGQAKMWQKFKEWSSVPMMISDKITVIPLWYAAYKNVLDKGNILTDPNLEQKAIEEADRVIRRTQPMGRALHLPETFRGGAFQRAYTLFTNQLNQNFNREYEQTSAFLDKKIKASEWLRTQLTLVVLSGLLIGFISRKRFPTPKEMIYDSISQLSGGVFLIGNIADAVAMGLLTKRFADVGKAVAPKSFGTLTELGNAAIAKTGRGRFKHITAAAGALAGFPYIQAGRTIETLKDVYDVMEEGMGQ